MKFKDGEYAVYGINEKGTKSKVGSFTIEDNNILKSSTDIIPEGEINSRVANILNRYINDHHGYIHVEKV